MKILVCEENGDYVDHLIEKLKSFPCDEELVFESYTQTPGVAKRLEREEYDMAFLGGIINGRNGFELGKMLKEKILIVFFSLYVMIINICMRCLERTVFNC